MLTTYFTLMLVVATSISGEESAQAICGRQLSQVIVQLCTSMQNYEPLKETMAAYVRYLKTPKAESYVEVPEIAEDSMWPWLSRRFLNGHAGWIKQVGLEQECCHKSCSMSQLLSYC